MAGGPSDLSYLNSVFVRERSRGNLGRGVACPVVERSSVRSVVRPVGWTNGAELGGSQANTETSQQ